MLKIHLEGHDKYYGIADVVRAFYIHPVEDKDGVNGAEAILQKVQIIREWFRTAWGIELDELRDEVQYRQATYDMNELRKMVYDIQ